MAFHVGQKVVCVDVSEWNQFWRSRWNLPEQGGVYTIREILTDACNVTCLRLLEIHNREAVDIYTFERGEPMFLASRFRPVRTTDISIFQSMLRKAPAKEPA